MVPGVQDIVHRIRTPLTPEEKAAFDRHLSGAVDDAERYQQAFQWLGLRRNPNYRDRVIQLTTLAACRRDDIPEEKLLGMAGSLELQSDRWSLTSAQESLGRILAGLPAGLRGPVLTTNFDPLTEIAVRKAGSNPTIFVNADDTSFLANLRVQTNPFVLHLHGYWRDSVTLSTPEQLEQARPILEASLRYVLEHYTLVVVGYGGWSDVITRIIRDQIANQQIENLDILWTFFSSDEDARKKIAAHPVLADLAAAPGNIQFYTGVNANDFLPQLEKRIAAVLEYPDRPRTAIGAGGPVGWTPITGDFLHVWETKATKSSAMTFFDGRLPTWADGVSAFVPVRTATVELHSRVQTAIDSLESSVDIVLGASGEGKTTVLLQLAKMLTSTAPSANILMLESDHLVSENSLLQLPAEESYVLIIDEAYRFTERLEQLITRIHAVGRQRMHFVLASRDTDWVATGASLFPWARYASGRTHAIHGISFADARTLIATWEKMGPAALGERAEYQTSEERVEALVDASHGLGLKGAGTLLGALLATRIGPGLRDHVAALMGRLHSRLIRHRNQEDTLLDALVMIALPYAYELLDLEPAVLADALDLDWPDLVTGVLSPLGEEAAITFSSGRVVMRHEMIASAVIDVSLQNGYDLKSAIARLVSAAARRLQRDGYAPRTGSIAYMASVISDLPDLAIAAARAAATAVPTRLSYRTHLSAALRKNSDASEAARVNIEALPLLGNAPNADQGRSFLTEWGVVEGNLSNWARNAVLVGISLQDSPSLGEVYADRSSRGVSCLLLALRKLYERHQDEELLNGVACATLLARSLGSRDSRAWLREAERMLDRIGGTYPDPHDLQTMAKSLKRALVVARTHLEEPLPNGVPFQTLAFEGLMRAHASRA